MRNGPWLLSHHLRSKLSELTLESLLDALRVDVLAAAPMLLGCHLIRGDIRSRIVEVEAYRDDDDPGCHAFYGRTPRTEIMFGEPGLAYVYFTYGNHWMLNVTAHSPGRGAAVLIRAAEPLSGIEVMIARRRTDDLHNLLSGPGKLAQAYGIGKEQYGVNLLSQDSEIRIELGSKPERILSGPRIGLSIGKGDHLPWRFADGNSLDWVSAKKTNLV